MVNDCTLRCKPIHSIPIIGLAIGKDLYRLVFLYRLLDQFVYRISSRSNIFGGQLHVCCELNFCIVSGWPRSHIPYENLRLTVLLQQPIYSYVYLELICIYYLTDNETFSLWDGSFATYAKQN